MLPIMEMIFLKRRKSLLFLLIQRKFIDTITDTKEIEDFVSALNLDQWELKRCQMKRLKSVLLISTRGNNQTGQTDTDGTLYDIATITLYNGAYISFEIGGFDMTFERE